MSIFCRFGFHSWRNFHGRLIIVGNANRALIVYNRECRRCGLEQDDQSLVV